MRISITILLTVFGLIYANQPEVKVSIKQPFPAEFLPLEKTIRDHVITAVREWSRYFYTVPCTIDVEFGIRDWANRGGGRSFASAMFEDQHLPGKFILDQGASYELRTGIDPNGEAVPDIELFFDPNYFRTLWFDPDPAVRTAALPRRELLKLDAYSVILHEVAHALCFNGFLDSATAQMSSNYLSTYDRWVTLNGDKILFQGPNAMKAYGKALILSKTQNTYHHLGELRFTNDSLLTKDIMNGIHLDYSYRYRISALDLGILQDCGMKLR